MGADGGIKISNIDDIKKDWVRIKERLISNLEDDLANDSWSVAKEDVIEAKKLPDDISNLTGNEICQILQFLKSCDCPYLLDGKWLITGEGDNVDSAMICLSNSLHGISIETWT